MQEEKKVPKPLCRESLDQAAANVVVSNLVHHHGGR